MKLDIITHCFCPPGVSHYARCLEWQYQSLVSTDHGPFREVKLIVVATSRDDETCNVLSRLLDNEADVSVEVEMQPPEKLFRRAIARNKQSLRSKANVVWFADVDYFVGPRFFDSLAKHVPGQSAICFPDRYRINRDHATGDEMLNRKFHIDEEKFIDKGGRRAIGGMLFVSSQVAQQGYLDGTRWQRPCNPEHGFSDYRCDIHYRKQVGECKRIPLEGFYRIRHSINGRDFSVDGVER